MADPKVFNIPSGIPFAAELAKGVISRVGGDPLALADVVIFVPTRRAARNLGEAFVREQKGAALGPRIRALGDVEDDEFAFELSSDNLELPRAMPPLRRRLLLAQLVQHWHRARGDDTGLVQAVTYADELAHFLDEVQTHGIALGDLDKLVTSSLATHWQHIVEFLKIISERWPPIRDAEGATDPAIRRNEMLKRVADRFATKPPHGHVIAAGSTGSIPATAALLKVIGNLPNGAVVLPGLDTALDDKTWSSIEEQPGHPQYGLHQLLARLGVERKGVAQWGHQKVDMPRTRFLSEALRPPPTTDAWRDLAEKEKTNFEHALDGMSLVEAATPREEAAAIACALREVLEAPGRTAALVTPDRGLARRVSAELSRWDITIDDSAGQPLLRMEAGAFLALLAQAAAEQFAPVPLLALLKHPLCAGGKNRLEFLRRARELEKLVLHGLRPAPGLEGLAQALKNESAPGELTAWFEGVRAQLSPLAEAMENRRITLGDMAHIHGLCGEALSATDSEKGPARLWRGDGGEAAAQLMSELWEQGAGIPLGEPPAYGELFREFARARAVRPTFGRHPRLAILGPLEARLLHFDLWILGGLNEGTWPTETATDPWLSRPLRTKLGLVPVEQRIGLAAHDFATLAANRNVLLTRALKQDGAPTVAARWVLRVKQLAAGLGIEAKLAPDKPFLDWARALDDGPRIPRATPPSPKPPLTSRPRNLRVTEIEKWQRDPYAIYAKYILDLKLLDPIDMEPGPAERGTVIHNALERFLIEYPKDLPAEALARFFAIALEEFAKAGASPAVLALWEPRFQRAARWFLDFEASRRHAIVQSVAEKEGTLELTSPAGKFTLRGRADRIDFFRDGKASILDYKTGRVPTHKEVRGGLNPQLPLEAAMLLDKGFEGLTAKGLHHLIYVRLTGGDPAGEECIVAVEAEAAAHAAREMLMELVARYDDEAAPYLSRLRPRLTSDVGDYDHLARVREWMVYGEDENDT